MCAGGAPVAVTARYSAGLIAAASASEAGAIERLLMLARPDIRRYARQKCRSASDAEDAIQETLFVLFRKAESLRRIESMSAWLFTVVYRFCLKLPAKVIGGALAIDTANRAGKLSAMPVADLRIDLVNALESLPPHYCQVILLRDIEELTIDEIAARLGATREAVKARLNRGRVLVREYLIG